MSAKPQLSVPNMGLAPGSARHVPELQNCCGTLCDRDQLNKEVTALVERNLLLEMALRELKPDHELL